MADFLLLLFLDQKCADMAAGVLAEGKWETRPLICDHHILSKPQLNTVCCRKGSEVDCLLSAAFGNGTDAQSVGFSLMDYAAG